MPVRRVHDQSGALVHNEHILILVHRRERDWLRQDVIRLLRREQQAQRVALLQPPGQPGVLAIDEHAFALDQLADQLARHLEMNAQHVAHHLPVQRGVNR